MCQVLGGGCDLCSRHDREYPLGYGPPKSAQARRDGLQDPNGYDFMPKILLIYGTCILGGMFQYVSGANFFGEILEWTGFAIASWSLPVRTMGYVVSDLFSRDLPLRFLLLRISGPVHGTIICA